VLQGPRVAAVRSDHGEGGGAMAAPPRAAAARRDPVLLRRGRTGAAEAPLQGGRGRARARRGVARRREQAVRRRTWPAARQPHRHAFAPIPRTSVRGTAACHAASRGILFFFSSSKDLWSVPAFHSC
jgi:hypothetical protein